MNSLQSLRWAGVIEGISFLLLLFIAMPLKYGAGFDMAVTVVGAAHGGLFVLYVAIALFVWVQKRWPFLRMLIAVIVSVIPFGPFVFERSLRREENEELEPGAVF